MSCDGNFVAIVCCQPDFSQLILNTLNPTDGVPRHLCSSEFKRSITCWGVRRGASDSARFLAVAKSSTVSGRETNPRRLPAVSTISIRSSDSAIAFA